MNEKLDIIERMYGGDIEAIISNVFSKNEYLVMNAILSGTQNKVLNVEFLEGVKKAQNSETVLMGIPLKSVAEASIHVLIGKKYEGNDDFIKNLILNNFNI